LPVFHVLVLAQNYWIKANAVFIKKQSIVHRSCKNLLPFFVLLSCTFGNSVEQLRKQTQVFCVSNENQLMRLMLNGTMIVTIIVLLCSCTNDKERKVYQALDNGFTSSYKLISRQNQIVLASLENKKWEPATSEKASVWYEKALAIKKSSDSMMEYIGKLKTTNQKEKDKMIELYDSLEKYKRYVLSIDPIIQNEFYNKISLVDSSIRNEEETLQSDISIPLLSSFQNNLAMAENKLLSFCHDQTARTILICMQDMPIVFQNAKYVRPGDQIEITAGVGKFMRMVDEKIIIAGENIGINESAVATYKIKAPSQIGKHTFPVRIEYKDQDGKLQWITKEVEFTVMKQ
jgi:hypothetical protein